jgi:hypothetical protein
MFLKAYSCLKYFFKKEKVMVKIRESNTSLILMTLCKPSLNHIAVVSTDKKLADLFFSKILELPKVRSFTISESLSEAIFQQKEQIDINVYDNGILCFEVFITKHTTPHIFDHVCLEVKNRDAFIKRCREFAIKPILIQKNGKQLVFIRDFSHNLYEIKEKTKVKRKKD